MIALDKVQQGIEAYYQTKKIDRLHNEESMETQATLLRNSIKSLLESDDNSELNEHLKSKLKTVLEEINKEYFSS